MLKTVLTNLIRMKNPTFSFDEGITSYMIATLIRQKAGALLRSLRLVVRGRIPKGVFLGSGVKLLNLPNIRFGRMVLLEDYVYINALGKKPVSLGDNVRIGAFSRLIISTTYNDLGDYITIGNNVGIGEFAYLGGAGGLEIGDDCIIGQYLSCHPENHCFDNPGQLIRQQGTTRKGIHIGNNCWIGSKVTVLDGVTIGDNCVVAAGAVVTKDMPANSVIGGVPAKVIKPITPKQTARQVQMSEVNASAA